VRRFCVSHGVFLCLGARKKRLCRQAASFLESNSAETLYVLEYQNDFKQRMPSSRRLLRPLRTGGLAFSGVPARDSGLRADKEKNEGCQRSKEVAGEGEATL
jgi:hypothetical protein